MPKTTHQDEHTATLALQSSSDEASPLAPGCFGVTIFYGHQPMPRPCNDCPFVADEEGNDFLAPGRLDGIKFAVAAGQLFPCHKTVHTALVPDIDDEGNKPSWHRTYRACAGGNRYAELLASSMGIEPCRIGSKP